MIIKKYKTDLGTHHQGNSDEEKMKYIWENFKKLYKESNFHCMAV